MLQATTHLIICHSKSKIFENFQTATPRNKQNMFIAILLSFFILCFANFIYSQLTKSGRGVFRALSKIEDDVLGKNSQKFQRRIHKGVEHLRWSFLRKNFLAVNYFSHSLFKQKAPSQMFDTILNTPLELLTIFAKAPS